MIRHNAHKYSVSADVFYVKATMCVILDIPKSTYYYHTDVSSTCARKTNDAALSKEIERIFKASRNNYDTRKIKKELAPLPEPKQVSRRQIGRLMSEIDLVLNYTLAQFKPHKASCNEARGKN